MNRNGNRLLFPEMVNFDIQLGALNEIRLLKVNTNFNGAIVRSFLFHSPCHMKGKIVRFLKYALSLGVLLLLFKTCVPGTFPVPAFHIREGTRFWNLPTGSRIGYTLVPARGNKKPYPVIYLHGGPGGPIFDANINRLSPLSEDGYEVYLYDQIGGGQSDRLADINEYTVARHLNDLEEIIRQIGAPKVMLIGQSWGAMLAAAFVANHPDQVDKIVFTSPGPVLPVRRELKDLPPPDSLHLKAPQVTNADGRSKTITFRMKVVEFWAKAFGKKFASDREVDAFATFMNQEMRKSTVCDPANAGTTESGAGFYVQLMTVESFSTLNDTRDELRKLALPVLVMKGQCDNQPWGYTHEYFDLFQNHRFALIPNAGHSIGTEQPALYINTIRDFLNH
jgi:proline iminopeptidase